LLATSLNYVTTLSKSCRKQSWCASIAGRSILVTPMLVTAS
jgi:hypothetical protein